MLNVLLRLEDRPESESVLLQDKILAKIEAKYKKYSLKKLMNAFDGLLDKYYATQQHREALEKTFDAIDARVIELMIKEHKQLMKYEILRIRIREEYSYIQKASEV